MNHAETDQHFRTVTHDSWVPQAGSWVPTHEVL